MEQIGNILQARTRQEPPEISAIKHYISDHFQATAQIAIQNESIIVTVSSASLANTLRLRQVEIQAVAQTTRKVIFRIG